MRLRSLLSQLADLRRRLDEYGVRDTGDYAEILIAAALGGCRNRNGVTQGFDVTAPTYGKIEVRSRTLPMDGRQETRVELPETKRNRFDWFAGIIFSATLDAEAAYLLPHDAAWKLAGDQKYSRIPLRNALRHAEVRDITTEVREASELL